MDPFALSSGARFFKCALQVNPFSYAQKKGINYGDAAAYNSALVEELLRQGVEVIAITDHHNVESSRSLFEAATAARIATFPAFEAESKDGIHVLCLFPPDTEFELIERRLANCGIVNVGVDHQCDIGFDVLLSKMVDWGGICVAPHITLSKGLLSEGTGSTRAKRWKNEQLLAVGIPGEIAGLAPGVRSIVENKDATYRRDRPPAVINCNDVWDPAKHLAVGAGASTLIKMSVPSIEGLRQAFIDPESRVRLVSDSSPSQRMEIEAITWDGGFLDGEGIHFNDNFNVLVGGRGCGKSTVIESIRFALAIPPIGDDIAQMHENITRFVLRSGTKVTLWFRTFRPNEKRFRIERTIGSPPVVRDEAGSILTVTPQHVFPNISILGQHEIAELAKGQTYLTELLGSFATELSDFKDEERECRAALVRNRTTLLSAAGERDELSRRLQELPAVQLELKRYEEAGFAARLQQRSSLESEVQILRRARTEIDVLQKGFQALEAHLPINTSFSDPQRIAELGTPPGLSDVQPALNALSEVAEKAAEGLASELDRSRKRIDAAQRAWETHAAVVQAQYENTLRELQGDAKDSDGQRFIKLRMQVEQLGPLADEAQTLEQKVAILERARGELLVAWDDLQRRKYRVLEGAGNKLNATLNKRLKVSVHYGANRKAIHNHIDKLGGRLKELHAVVDTPGFSHRGFAQAVRRGKAEIAKAYTLPDAQAEKLAQASLDSKLRLEEIELEHHTDVELNVGAGGAVEWRTLGQLSTGQKATAVLLLLLASEEAPLVIDQPEDDLDNFFISDSVVPEIRAAKRRRQFVFATHNANLPVLGDAELIVGLSAMGDATGGKGKIPGATMGSIDSAAVKELVGQVLEGGKLAFLQRREKYGY